METAGEKRTLLMSFKHRITASAIGILGLLVIGNAWASIDLMGESIRLSGFGTIGLTHGGDEGFGFRRDISREGQSSDSWAFEPDSVLGLQLDAQLTRDLDTAVQLVAKDRPINGLQESLEWAFLRYRLDPDLTIRVGRLGVDAFMLSEYRDVGFAYLWTRPPLEFYGPLAYENIDGADLAYSHPWGEGLFRVKLFGGKSTEDFGSNFFDDYSVDLTSYGTSLTWESDHWQVRLALVSGTIDNSAPITKPLVDGLNVVPAFLWPEAGELADDLDSNGKRVTYYSTGVRYDDYPWVLQAEAAYIDSDLPGLPVTNGYLSAGKRIGPVTLYGVAAIAKNPKGRRKVPEAPLPLLTPLQQGVQLAYDNADIDQSSLSFGLRWDIRHDLALKTQWDHHWIEPYGGGLWDQERPLTEERELDTFSINLNFVF
jgi:hypothetical protein